MKKKGTDDLEKDFESDDELYASYDAYKALLDAGVTKTDALKRTGLTAQIVKDLEAEEGEDEIKGEFKEVWYTEDEEDSWSEDGPSDLDDDMDWEDSGGGFSDDDEGGGSDWDDKY
ncbi:MAG: hypothetical protein K2X86_16155 [Cytophagaceae bacterium]|nr:hypothetical protein [Cytophagaceae bacterium]